MPRTAHDVDMTQLTSKMPSDITSDPFPWAHDHENLCDMTRMSGQHPARSASKETEDDYWDPRPE